MAAEKKVDPPTVRFEFPKAGKVQPSGFDKVTMEDKVRIIIDGTVASLAKDEYEWNPGKSMSVKITKCAIFPEDNGAESIAAVLYPEMPKAKKKG